MYKATLIICDDLTYHLNGKLNVHGLYSGDIVIPGPSARMNQLIFMFILESDPDKLPNIIEISVTLPNGMRIMDQIDPQSLAADESDKISWTLRSPLLLQGALLTPGHITASVKYDDVEVEVSAPIIKSVPFPGTLPADNT